MTRADKISIGIMVIFGSWLFLSCFWKTWKYNLFRLFLIAVGII